MYSLKIEKPNLEKYFEEFSRLSDCYFNYSEMIAYEEEYSQGALACEVVVCQKNNEVQCLLPFTLSREGLFSFFNKPAIFYWRNSLLSDDKFEICEKILQYLEKKIELGEIKKISLVDEPFFVHAFQNSQFIFKKRLEAFIDLNQSEEIIKRSIRKSYRSLINWGNREMKFIVIDKNNIDEKLFNDFRLFHIQVSGKETRSKKSWDHQLNFVKDGKAFLELGFLDEVMVSGILVLSGAKEAYYAVAVNDRSLMSEKKAIGHALMFNSIMKAKKNGCDVFNLGLVGADFSNEKEFEIGKFKMGFTSTTRIINSFEVNFEKDKGC